MTSAPSRRTHNDASDAAGDRQPVQGAKVGSSRTSLSAEALSFAYGDKTVLAGVNLELRPHGFLALLGPNGSGKSTMLRLLIGSARPAGGVVKLNGEAMGELSERRRAQWIAYVEQQADLSYPLTVRDVVMMGRHPYQRRWQWEGEGDLVLVQRAMQAVGIDHLAERPVTQLSGGESQLVSLARAFAQDTPFLVLDEPTASLDLRYALQILHHIKRFTREGGSAIAAMHDLNLAAASCDAALLLRNGQPLAYGPIDEVLTEENVRAAYGVEVRIGRSDVHGHLTVTPLPLE